MGDTYITDNGKLGMLQKAFLNDKGFKYLALGGENSSAVQSTASASNADNFQEVSGDGYSRSDLVLSNTGTKSITLYGTFDDSNYSPVGGGIIKEIAIFDSANDGTIWGIAKVPEITKKDSVSMQYNLIISLD